jgi:hypothetical protein
LGHSESERLVSASWARRVLVRFLECRRFGFGMKLPLVNRLSPMVQGRHGPKEELNETELSF